MHETLMKSLPAQRLPAQRLPAQKMTSVSGRTGPKWYPAWEWPRESVALWETDQKSWHLKDVGQ